MGKNIIEVKKLSKKFKDFLAVDEISFEVGQGEIFAFLGPNGAGKSTSIKMLTTLLRPSGGEVKINGFDILKNERDVRSSFGIVFQDPSVDGELTAYENMYFHAVLYGVKKTERKKKIQSLLEMVELIEKKDVLVKNFSGGMKRRLEIARGFLHHPEIIFLDEPTLGLDPQTRNKIWDYVKKINKNEGTTIFFTTHYMAEVEKVADRVAIIDNGKIIKIGTVEEINNLTGKNNLEDSFLHLTGKNIREEGAEPSGMMRRMARR